MLLALLLQAAPTVARATAAPPQRFSILARPCAPVKRDGQEVVVCGDDPQVSQRLPLPGQAEPTPGYVKPDSGDYRDNKGGSGACPSGCEVGFGPPIAPLVNAAANAIGNARKDARWAAARKRDGAHRVPIALEGAEPMGRVEP